MILGLTHYDPAHAIQLAIPRNRYCSNSIAYLCPSQQDSIRSLIPPEMARTSVFFGVKPKVFCQKRLKFSFPEPFFFGSFDFVELAEVIYEK